MLKLALTLTLGATCAFAFYSETLVTKLTEDNFKKEVVKDKNSVWVIEFYSPYCGLAKAFKPHFEKVAESLKGVAKVGAVDITSDSDVTNEYEEIPFYPAIGVFTKDKKNPRFFGIKTLDGAKALRFIEKQLKIEYFNRISLFTGEKLLTEDDIEIEVDIEEELVPAKEKEL